MKSIAIPEADTIVEIYPDHTIVRYIINWEPHKEKTVRYKTLANAVKGIRKEMKDTVLEDNDAIQESLANLEMEIA